MNAGRGAQHAIDGLLVLDKPAGMTSHAAVARVRRITGQRRTGHAGTLDPLATGVLPLGLGQGARVLEYLTAAGKTYRAVIRLGVSTDTYDSEGTVVRVADAGAITCGRLQAVLTGFHGTIQQRPPRFSALKRGGRPLYDYARAGIEVELQPRPVRIDALRLCRFDPPEFEIEIDCGSGFYVRSLAHDIGDLLGCGAHLTALTRTRVGPFLLADAVTLTDLEAAATAEQRVLSLLRPLDTPLLQRPAVILGPEHTAAVRNGKPLSITLRRLQSQGALLRAYSAAGEFLAILAAAPEGRLQPLKVFPLQRRGPSLEESFHPIVLSS